AFTVPAGYHTLTFVGLNPTGGDNTAFVDQVQINVVLSGFGSRGSGFEVPQASTPPPVGFQPLPSEPIRLLPDDPPKKEARKPLWDSGRVAAVGGRTRIVPPEKLAPVCVSADRQRIVELLPTTHRRASRVPVRQRLVAIGGGTGSP